MAIPPIPIGLHLCEKAEFDPVSKRYSISGIFQDIWTERLPTEEYLSFIVYAPVTGGRGEGVLELQALEFQGEMLYRQTRWVRFSDPILIHHLEFRLTQLALRQPGQHVFRLLFDGVLINERSFHVFTVE